MSTLDDIRAKRRELEAIERKYGVGNVPFFGSVLRGDDRPDSDVDLLVTFDKYSHRRLDIGGFQYDSSTLLGSRVDIVMDHHIHDRLAPYIEKEAPPL